MSSCEMKGLVGSIVVSLSISRVAQGFLPVTPIADWMQMQMNIDNSPAQELIIQPANQPAPTLFLDFTGSTDDGQQYVTSILQCENPEDIVKWGVEHTGAHDATVQALSAMEATSAGEYVSKTVGSIGTVNHQLQRHEHEILVNEHLGTENKLAVDGIREDIKTERGNLRACQRFVADLDKDVKIIQMDAKTVEKDIKNVQDNFKTVQNDVKIVQNSFEAIQQELKSRQKETEVLKMLQDQNEMLKQEVKIHGLILESILKKVSSGDDEEIQQVSFPNGTPSQHVANDAPVD